MNKLTLENRVPSKQKGLSKVCLQKMSHSKLKETEIFKEFLAKRSTNLGKWFPHPNKCVWN